MSRRRPRIQVVRRSCRRGCGKQLAGLNRPIHGSQADFDKYHGICENCLTDDEKTDMKGPMLLRTAQRIVGAVK